MEQLMIFIQILFINLLLSGDNAIVIALASQHLPSAARRKAVFWGAFAAIGLRVVLTLIAITLLQVPLLQAGGALLLLLIAIKLLADAQAEDAHIRVRKAVSLQAAIWTIVTADFIMSLDNVLAIAAIAGTEPLLMLLGIGLSVPIIIWGSELLGALLRRLPLMIYAGAGLLGYAAGRMLVEDPLLAPLLHKPQSALAEAIPLLCVPLVIVLALLRTRTRLHAG